MQAEAEKKAICEKLRETDVSLRTEHDELLAQRVCIYYVEFYYFLDIEISWIIFFAETTRDGS